jgi:protein-S-isoprenylcysteine O-methyltransferase Ste14
MKALQFVIPPVYLLISLLLMLVLHYQLPLLRLIPVPYTYTGISLIIAGLALAILGAGMFRRADTPVRPFQKSTTLLVHGLFRYSRNPMYLGLLLILLGTAILLGSLSPFLVILVFFVIIQEGYVKHEERFLEELFGEAYRSYKRRVRRWF